MRNTTSSNLLDLDQSSSVPLYLQVIQALRDKILNGQYGEQELLPSPKRLGNYNMVSWITIDRAYRQLETDGFLIRKKNVGYYVNAMPAPKPHALFLINHPTNYSETQLLEDITELEDRVLVEVKIFYNDVKLLENIVKQSLEKFKYFIFLSSSLTVKNIDAYLKVLACIPTEKLVLLDEELNGHQGLKARLQEDGIYANVPEATV